MKVIDYGDYIDYIGIIHLAKDKSLDGKGWTEVHMIPFSDLPGKLSSPFKFGANNSFDEVLSYSFNNNMSEGFDRTGNVTMVCAESYVMPPVYITTNNNIDYIVIKSQNAQSDEWDNHNVVSFHIRHYK